MEKIKKNIFFALIVCGAVLSIIACYMVTTVSSGPGSDLPAESLNTPTTLIVLFFSIACVFLWRLASKERTVDMGRRFLSPAVLVLALVLMAIIFSLYMNITGAVRLPSALALFLVNLAGLSIFVAYSWYCVQLFQDHKKQRHRYIEDKTPAYIILLMLVILHSLLAAGFFVSGLVARDGFLPIVDLQIYSYLFVFLCFVALLRGLVRKSEWARVGLILLSYARLAFFSGVALYTGNGDSLALVAPLDLFTLALAHSESVKESTGATKIGR